MGGGGMTEMNSGEDGGTRVGMGSQGRDGGPG